MITGQDLIDWDHTPGNWFKGAIEAANNMEKAGHSLDEIKEMVASRAPVAPVYIQKQVGSSVPIHYNIDVEGEGDAENIEKVRLHMEELATIPTIRALAVMPDACPSGRELGTIPVGGVAVAEAAIHPGMHSNDVCCSVAITVFDDCDQKAILDAGMQISHFGAGGRKHSHDMQVGDDLLGKFEGNAFLRQMTGVAQKHFATQGDGNHFFYVGRLESTGQVALVTHHGSRKPGAELYSLGIDAAWRHTRDICPEVSKHNAWIPYETKDGEDYWEALQLIRMWTKKNHFAIHDGVAKMLGLKVRDRYWNEHNFVFMRGRHFYHAKGATPNYRGFSSDWSSKTLIPLNMAAPILICETHEDTEHGANFEHTSLGFSPHGAGRNYSRTAFNKSLGERGLSPKDMIARYTSQYDIRAYSGKYDISEFPEAYKEPKAIVDAINKYDLTRVVDRVMPYGSIMAGHNGWARRDKKEKADAVVE